MAGKDNPTTSRGSSNTTTKALSKPGTSAATTAPNANNANIEEPAKITSNALSTAKSAKIYLIENGLATTGMEYTIATLSNILMQISHNAPPLRKQLEKAHAPSPYYCKTSPTRIPLTQSSHMYPSVSIHNSPVSKNPLKQSPQPPKN
ncbi:hypothetical protein BD410DRAFT_845830 [Rickenella mellea]|uniref:Uncharacterized protein n=1 Tax=Rickenella mellea TaxID=50990 RepID=A0A4Y7PGR9_9AGAM|nr:hypothetical protein BD410DRAFT_845830 [Rickenella mellea]